MLKILSALIAFLIFLVIALKLGSIEIGVRDQSKLLHKSNRQPFADYLAPRHPSLNRTSPSFYPLFFLKGTCLIVRRENALTITSRHTEILFSTSNTELADYPRSGFCLALNGNDVCTHFSPAWPRPRKPFAGACKGWPCKCLFADCSDLCSDPYSHSWRLTLAPRQQTSRDKPTTLSSIAA